MKSVLCAIIFKNNENCCENKKVINEKLPFTFSFLGADVKMQDHFFYIFTCRTFP